MSATNRVQTIMNCYQCRYGSESSEDRVAWCSEASRVLPASMEIPEWCPLPVVKP